MEPLSSRTRRTYFAVFLGLFVIFVPLAVLYATGYRLSDFSLAETGGVYVTAPATDVVITLNGEEIGTSGLFDRTIYVDNLSPGTYVVQAVKDGYYPWSKTLTVEPWIVTDVASAMVPTALNMREIRTMLADDSATSTTLVVTAAERAAFMRAFTATTTVPVATTTPRDTAGGVELFIEAGDVVLRWGRSEESVPSSFCIRPSSCAAEYRIERGAEVTTNASFFAGGVVYQVSSGIYFSDGDVRSPQLILPLYTRPKAEFRVVDDALVIKDGAVLYRIESWQ